MTVTVVKGDPLAGIANRAQVASKIGTLLDESASYQERKDAAGWLRGAWDVIRRTPKQAAAADYINDLLNKHRYREDTTGE